MSITKQWKVTDWGQIPDTPVYGGRNKPEVVNSIDQKYCNHEWKEILLLNTTVYNCKHCDKKKEDYEKEQKESSTTEWKTDWRDYIY